MRIVVVFASADDADTSAVEEAVEADKLSYAEHLDNVSIFRRDRAVIVTGMADTDETFGIDVDDRSESPSSSEPALKPAFSSDYSADTNSVDLRVIGGDPFPAARVRVTGNKIAEGYERTLDAPVYFGENTELSAGKRFTVSLDGPDSDDFVLQLVWRSDDGDTSATIFETQGPDGR